MFKTRRTDTHGGTQLFSLDLNYDPNGNITARTVNGKTNTYVYDDLNQLIHADLYARQTEQVRAYDYGLGQVHEDYRGDKVVEVQPEDFEVNLDYAATSLSVIFNQVTERIQRIELVPQEATHRVDNKRYLAVYYKTSGDYRKLDPADWEFAHDAVTGKITITFPDFLTAYEVKIHCLFDDRDREYQPAYRRGTRSEFANLARSMVRVYRVYERRYEDYVYDRNGNRISETITTLYPRTYGYTYYPNSDRLKTRETSDGTTKWAFVYDNNGNLVEKGNTYTIAGDTVTFTTSGEGVVYWQYEYDVFNRLVSVKKNGVTVSRYVYDPSGLRIVKEAAETRIYDYDLAGNIIGEKNLSTGRVYSYVWVTGRHLARVDGVIGGSGEKYFYETDHLGSPMVVTDDSGNVVWRGDYAPFGERIKGEVEAGVFVDTHGFTGKDWDEDVGLYYFNARWYDSELGRFISEDPLEDPNNPNLYTYGRNNPLRFIDLTGLQTKENIVDFIKRFGEIIASEALRLKIDPNILGAVILTESSGKGLINNKLVIRFEAHIFDRITKKKYTEHFSYNKDKPWTEQKYRVDIKSDNWKDIHTGKQSSEYEVFNYAKELDEDAAYQSISMGMGQIMGFNYRAAGYNSAREMFEAFSKSEDEQIKGMIKLIENNSRMLKALQDGDLKTFIKLYNGPGQVDIYLKIMNNNIEIIKTYTLTETETK